MDARTATLTAPRPASATERRVKIIKAVLFVVCLLPLAREVWLVLSGAEVNPVEFVTRSTGLWTIVWLWVTLLISPLKKFTGWGWLLKLRRELGLFSFFYACLHLVCYLWFDKFFDWHAIGKDIVGRPFITIGSLAVLLLLPLAVTSTDGWMRRLKRNWSRLHWLVYPAAMLSVLHFLLEVKRDISEPLEYALLLTLLLSWRVLRWRQKRASP